MIRVLVQKLVPKCVEIILNWDFTSLMSIQFLKILEKCTRMQIRVNSQAGYTCIVVMEHLCHS